jgi:hypothetical protein
VVTLTAEGLEDALGCSSERARELVSAWVT